MDEAWLIPSEAVGLLLVLSWINQAELSSFHIGFSQFIWYRDGLFPFYFPRTYVGYSSPSTVSQTWRLILMLLNSSFSTWLALCPTLRLIQATLIYQGFMTMITKEDKTRENHPLMVWRLDVQVKMFLRAFFLWGLLRKDPSMLLPTRFNELLFVAPLWFWAIFLWLSYPYVLHISVLLHCLLDLESLFKCDSTWLLDHLQKTLFTTST